MSKTRRNFNGEKDLSRKVASFRMAQEVVKSKNEETMQKSAQSIRMLADFAKEEYGLKNLAKLDSEQISDFANYLQERLDNNEISAGHATNIISSLNTIFTYYYREDLKISAKEYGLNRGPRFDNVDKSITDYTHQKLSEFLTEKYLSTGNVKYEALRIQTELQRQLGLRFKESALFTGKELHKNGTIDILRGTKGGQLRTLTASEKQKELINSVKEFRKEFQLNNSLIPDNHNFKDWKAFSYNVIKNFREETGINYNFHGERHHYAQTRYKELTGHEPPVKRDASGENPVKKEKDLEIRLQISEELGHHRVDITSYYLGK